MLHSIATEVVDNLSFLNGLPHVLDVNMREPCHAARLMCQPWEATRSFL